MGAHVFLPRRCGSASATGLPQRLTGCLFRQPSQAQGLPTEVRRPALFSQRFLCCVICKDSSFETAEQDLQPLQVMWNLM